MLARDFSVFGIWKEHGEKATVMLKPLLIVILVFAVLPPLRSEAQPVAKIPRVGVLLPGGGGDAWAPSIPPGVARFGLH